MESKGSTFVVKLVSVIRSCLIIHTCYLFSVSLCVCVFRAVVLFCFVLLCSQVVDGVIPNPILSLKYFTHSNSSTPLCSLVLPCVLLCFKTGVVVLKGVSLVFV